MGPHVVIDGDTPSATERQVELGSSLRGWIDVRSGIDPGARVVVRGNEALREGQQVRILSVVPGTAGSH